MLTDYIYINENSMSSELCEDIISMFENQETGKYTGITQGGIQQNVKDTVDFMIPKNDAKWMKMNSFLSKELNNNILEYTKKNNEKYNKISYNLFQSEYFEHSDFMIQRYIQNKGRYTYHNDFNINYEKKIYRVLTYLWYLNDVVEGGETEFFGGDFKIQPKKGTLILFPASWTYPHCGKMPISSNKYIITGWLYIKYGS